MCPWNLASLSIYNYTNISISLEIICVSVEKNFKVWKYCISGQNKNKGIKEEFNINIL
jgi:hypothetical protein